MKTKIILIGLVVFFITSLVFAQVDKATGTLTNDATQTRLRIAHLIFNGPNVDFFVNGEIAINGGQQQVNIPVGYINGYLYLEPGTYSVAITPTGKSIDEALLGPLELELAKGRRYTLAMVGQLEDNSIQPLVMDDTAILQKARTSKEQGIMILVNNLAGTETLDFTLGGQGPMGAKYGNFAAAPLAMPFGKPLTITTNVGSIAEGEEGGFQDPAMDFTVAFFGRFPGEDFRDTQSANISDLDLVAFLQEFSGLGFQWNGEPLSFDTFLKALEVTGFSEMLATGPYLVMAPTDEAFAELPKDQLEALMADPEALGDVLRNHIIEGYVPRGSVAKTPGGVLDRSFTNLLGKTIAIGDKFSVNGEIHGDLQSWFVANGTQIHPITKVLLPPSQ